MLGRRASLTERRTDAVREAEEAPQASKYSKHCQCHMASIKGAAGAVRASLQRHQPHSLRNNDDALFLPINPTIIRLCIVTR